MMNREAMNTEMLEQVNGGEDDSKAKLMLLIKMYDELEHPYDITYDGIRYFSDGKNHSVSVG